MSLPPSQLAIIAALDEPSSLAELARRIGRPEASVRTAVQALERDHLVSTIQSKGRRIVHAASPILVQKAKEMVFDLARPDWSRMFQGQRPRILWVLHVTGRAPLTAEVIGGSRRNVYATIEDTAHAGIIQIGSGRRTLDPEPWGEGVRLPSSGIASSGSKYRINPRLGPLIDFLREADRISAYGRLMQQDPEARLHWHLGPESLFSSQNEHPQAHPGGPTALAELGIELFTDVTYYHHALRKPCPADAILQTLLIDRESKVNRSYAALGYELALPSDLHEKATLYGLRQEAERLQDYVKQRTDPSGYFLPWSEHERYRRQYGVA